MHLFEDEKKKLQNWIDFSHFFTFFSIVWIRNGISQHNNAWKVDCSLVWIFECIKYDNAKEDLFYWSKKKRKKEEKNPFRYDVIQLYAYFIHCWFDGLSVQLLDIGKLSMFESIRYSLKHFFLLLFASKFFLVDFFFLWIMTLSWTTRDYFIWKICVRCACFNTQYLTPTQ